jgi:hypothetical protein
MSRKYRAIRKRFNSIPREPRMGVRQAFFEWLDPDLRDALVAIYGQHFPLEPRHEHIGLYERSRALTLRAVSALD